MYGVDIDGGVFDIVSISDETGGAREDTSRVAADTTGSIRFSHNQPPGSGDLYESFHPGSV